MRRRDVLRVCSSYFRNTPREERLAVIKRVGDAYGVTVKEIMGRSRVQPIAAVRQLAMQAVAAEFNDSLPQIGRLFGRDHTTIMHALQKPVDFGDKYLHRDARARKKKRAGNAVGAAPGPEQPTVKESICL